jgi:hypothetical protein
MRVTKREAFLLFILAIFGIVGMMMAFVIFPLMNENTNLQIELYDYQSKKLTIDTSLPNVENLQKTLETRLVEVSDSLNQLEAPINEAQFEQWVLPLTTKYDMRIIQTSFTEPEIVTPMAIDAVPNENYYAIRELVERYQNVVQVDESVPVTQSLVLLSQHTFVVETTYARFVYFLDEVTKWNTSIIITTSYYDYVESTGSFTFDLYSIHQLSPDEIEKDYTKDITAGGTGKGDSTEDPHPDGGK